MTKKYNPLKSNCTRLNKEEAKYLLECYDVIFFDLDGTLVDTNNINYRLYKNIFKQFGLPISKQKWEYFFNGSMLDMVLNKYLESIGRSDLFKFVLDYFQKNGDRLKMELFRSNEVKIIDAGYFLLKEVINLKKQLVLCTSSRRIFAHSILGKLNMNDIFNFIICGDDVKRGKPYPDIYNKAKLLTKNKKSLVVEDSLNGLISAQKAKCRCLIIDKAHYLLDTRNAFNIEKNKLYLGKFREFDK